MSEDSEAIKKWSNKKEVNRCSVLSSETLGYQAPKEPMSLAYIPIAGL